MLPYSRVSVRRLLIAMSVILLPAGMAASAAASASSGSDDDSVTALESCYESLVAARDPGLTTPGKPVEASPSRIPSYLTLRGRYAGAYGIYIFRPNRELAIFVPLLADVKRPGTPGTAASYDFRFAIAPHLTPRAVVVDAIGDTPNASTLIQFEIKTSDPDGTGRDVHFVPASLDVASPEARATLAHGLSELIQLLAHPESPGATDRSVLLSSDEKTGAVPACLGQIKNPKLRQNLLGLQQSVRKIKIQDTPTAPQPGARGAATGS